MVSKQAKILTWSLIGKGQQTWGVACRNRLEILYKQAKVALDSLMKLIWPWSRTHLLWLYWISFVLGAIPIDHEITEDLEIRSGASNNITLVQENYNLKINVELIPGNPGNLISDVEY